jgi:hypothetical protein
VADNSALSEVEHAIAVVVREDAEGRSSNATHSPTDPQLCARRSPS